MSNEPTPYAKLRVEMQPMGKPKPVGFGVFKDGRLLAFLTYEEVLRGIAEYDAMEAARKV